MRYRCTICGYIFDEEAEGAAFADLPDTWTCPLCSAPKIAFEPESPSRESDRPMTPESPSARQDDGFLTAAAEGDGQHLSELPAGVLAAICSNLARGCEKQYKFEEQGLFDELAAWFTAAGSQRSDASLSDLSDRFKRDLDEGYPALRDAAVASGDRGTQRICVWGEKVTRILSSLAARYAREGEAALAGTRIWVCTVCGFAFIGDRPPALCPVCKVPDWKFDEIKGRVA